VMGLTPPPAEVVDRAGTLDKLRGCNFGSVTDPLTTSLGAHRQIHWSTGQTEPPENFPKEEEGGGSTLGGKKRKQNVYTIAMTRCIWQQIWCMSVVYFPKATPAG